MLKMKNYMADWLVNTQRTIQKKIHCDIKKKMRQMRILNEWKKN
jgi:hypothetical protein